MSNSIDKVVLDMGKSSNCSTSQKYHSTFYQTSKIIELMDRKRKMINLKIAVEDAISKMDKTNRRLLTLVFIDGAKCEMIAKIIGVSLRTFFRKKISAWKQFASLLEEMGYDEEFFISEYSSERWFMAVYDETLSKGCETDDYMDKYLVKRMFNEVSKTEIAYNTYFS